MFCGDRAGSKEHVWPEWLLKMTSVGPVVVDAERGGEKLKSWKQLDHKVTTKHVCGSCNNGWMSQLENRTKPVVTRLMEDTAGPITPSEQRTIAAWMLKTAMVFEALRVSGSPWFYTFEERARMRNTRGLPSRTRVWIAKCVDLPGAYCTGSDLSETNGVTSNEARAYLTTMGIGNLALQALTLRLPEDVPDSTRITTGVRSGPWNECTISVWPEAQVDPRWPPRLGFRGEQGLAAFSARFRPPYR